MLKTVLIVDDCEAMATPLEISLASMQDIEILTLRSAVDALTILGNSAYHVAAVVTDLHLPLMTGLELIDNIRSHSRYSKIPIIVVTGDGNPGTRIHVLQKGANAYFPKPYSPADVQHELDRLLHAG